MPKKREPRTVLELCVAKAGVLRGPRVVVFLALWALAMERNAEVWPTLTLTDRMPLYAETAAVVLPTAWRQLKLFRQVFDLAHDPTEVVDRLGLLDQVDADAAEPDFYSVGVMPI